MAKRLIPERDRGAFRHPLAAHASPLRRPGTPTDPRLQRGKERNVARVVERLDGLCIEPCQVFSFYHRVGRPSRWRGFLPGLELHAGQLASGVGGGLCQVANLVFLLALRAGMRIVERHRHGLDLFRDHRRTVPFGCGATVFYNLADLRCENPLRRPVLLELGIEDGWLSGRLLADEAVGYRVEIYEVDHRFRQLDGHTWRENRIRRRFLGSDGATLFDHEVCHNVARVVYPIDGSEPTEPFEPTEPSQCFEEAT
jgi:vancomycin resistance protein VanW